MNALDPMADRDFRKFPDGHEQDHPEDPNDRSNEATYWNKVLKLEKRFEENEYIVSVSFAQY